MRKYLLNTALMLVLILSAKTASAQKFYAYFLTGKHFAIANEWIENTYNRNAAGNIHQFTFYYSLGEGSSAGIGLGYNFNENISAELGASYFQAKQLYVRQKDELQYSEDVMKIKGFAVWLAPALKLNLPLNEKHKFYTKASAIIGTGRFISEFNSYSGTKLFEMMYTAYRSVNFGMSAAFGYEYRISNRLSITSELSAMSFTFTPKRGKYLRLSYDGIDYLSGRSEKAREINFVDKQEYGVIEPGGGETRMQRTRDKYPVKNIGLSLGVTWRF